MTKCQSDACLYERTLSSDSQTESSKFLDSHLKRSTNRSHGIHSFATAIAMTIAHKQSSFKHPSFALDVPRIMSFPTSFPPLFPRLVYRIPGSDLEHNPSQPSSTSLFSAGRIQNQSQHGRDNSQDDNKILSDIDREEIRLQARV